MAPEDIMLLPMMRDDLFDKLSKYGIDLGIGKPITPSVLLDGIMDIFEIKVVSGFRPSTSGEHGTEKLGKPCKVLLAEDNKTNQMIVKSLLEQIGAEAIIAGDGMEAGAIPGAWGQHRPGADGSAHACHERL